MSVDYQHNVIIGFRVDGDLLFDENTGSYWSCEHAQALVAAAAAAAAAANAASATTFDAASGTSPKHCPECGNEVKEFEETNQVLKPELTALLADEEEWYDGVWEGDLNGTVIRLVRYWVNSDTLYFVGFEITSGCDRDDLGIQREDVPQIPSESDMAIFLANQGIPFDSDTWGMWKIGTAS